MPIRAFWNMNTQIARVRSEELLDSMDLFLIANMNVDGKMVQQIRQAHIDRMGNPMTFTEPPPEKVHEEGIAELQRILGA